MRPGQVVKLLRMSADHIAGGQTSEALHTDLRQLPAHLVLSCHKRKFSNRTFKNGGYPER